MKIDIDLSKLRKIIKAALAEDVGAGDITTEAVISPGKKVCAKLILKQKGMVAGLPIAAEIFKMVDPSLKFKALVAEGSVHKKVPIAIAEIKGRARSILIAERVVLNFMQRLSGISSLTSIFVRRVRGTRTKILDTRKTTPLLRILEKYAVSVGGGINHRMGLYDAVLIKDNHIKIVGDLFEAVRIARRDLKSNTPIEAEVSDLDEVKEAVNAGADIVLLDNMKPRQIRKAVRIVKEHNRHVGVVGARVLIEASGGVNWWSVRRIAKAGVDAISIGALTHSAKSLDISLEIL